MFETLDNFQKHSAVADRQRSTSLVFPILQDDGGVLVQNGLLPPSALNKAAQSKEDAQFFVEVILIKMLRRDLDFMKLAMPKIMVSAEWMPEIEEAEPWTVEDQIEVTDGPIPIHVFTLLFSLAVRATGASTTAHRRFNKSFEDTKTHFIVDADAGTVRAFMPQALMDALNTGLVCWRRGQ